MEKLVIYYTASDGCSYSYDQSIPVEYESAEALLIDLEEALKKYDADHKFNETTVKVGHLTFDATYGYISTSELPEIYTLEEWFEIHKQTDNI